MARDWRQLVPDKTKFFKFLLRLGWELVEIHPEWDKLATCRWSCLDFPKNVHDDAVKAWEYAR